MNHFLPLATLMDMIQLLAIDLDDTLLTEDLDISMKNRKAVRAAEAAGVTVLLASGRTLFSMRRYGRELDMWRRSGYMIANNGATVISTSTEEVVLEKPLEPALGMQVWEIVQGHGLTMQYYGEGDIYVSGPSEYTERDCLLTGQRWHQVDSFAASLTIPRTKFVIPGEPEVLPAVEKDLKNSLGERANIFTSKPYFLEVLRADADKGTALAYVAKELGIESGEVMAIGDSMNDFGMLSWAGIGVAMSNAQDKIKEIADYVTNFSHEDHGVAEAIERFIPEAFAFSDRS
ncbi:Cof-type HAD-IIB family hydrolase [Marispirochaeta sp.]|uniref:Cof-type HAD-IIB family hydrolase n=1 Tax=Marispirochaeta sp. TaxID=2038653 RepID=UPI0029C6E693|nr:Cof-type HAD-IIB family hydrolase [Marispirochaeta sp.]